MANDTSIRKDEYTGNEVVPPEGHSRVGLRIFEILAEILQYKDDHGLPAKWMRAYELSKNRHWRTVSKKAPLVTANLLHSHRVRTVNTLTDNNPTFDVVQVGEMDEQDPQKQDLFEDLLKTCEFWWSDTEQQSVLEESILNGELYGVTIEKSVFNRHLEGGLGEAETVVVDPWYFGWYPVKAKKLQQCHALLHFYPISVREARWRWPEKADEIISDDETIKALGDTRMEVKANSMGLHDQGYFTSIGAAIKQVLAAFGSGGDKGAATGSDETLIVECWVKDYSREKSADGMKEYDKYPGNIRCVICCSGGKVVLEDKPNPSINPDLDPEQASQTFLWHNFPFTKSQSHTDTGNAWGMSDFEQLEMLNIEVNKTISQLTLVKDRVARIKLINPLDSGVSNKEMTNAPGIINPSNALVAQSIRYLDPPSLNPELFKVLDIYRDLFFLVAGSFELESAQTPGRDVIAYKAIAALLERAATMLRGKIRNYERMIRERGRMYLSHVMNWYTEERFISYEQDGRKMTKAIRGNDMLIPAKLSVVSGSTMPVSRVQEREEALALFDKGAIDNEELLKKLSWNGYKDVIERMRQGPLGDLFKKLELMGFPQSMLQAFQEIGAMEMDEFDKLLKQGEIPLLPDLLSAPAQPGEPQPNPMETSEMELSAAKAEKERAETELIRAKIKTEEVIQMTKLAGIKLDKAKLSQDQARLVSEIRNNSRQTEIMGSKVSSEGPPSKDKPQGPYREKGMKSNNEARK